MRPTGPAAVAVAGVSAGEVDPLRALAAVEQMSPDAGGAR